MFAEGCYSHESDTVTSQNNIDKSDKIMVSIRSQNHKKKST